MSSHYPSLPDNSGILGYHSHVYFDIHTIEKARALCETTAYRFDIKMGRMHQRPIGPHPDWSCQLSYGAKQLNDVLPWLAMHRNGLVIFTHPLTGDDLQDHRDFAIWMGAIRPLNLDIFTQA